MARALTTSIAGYETEVVEFVSPTVTPHNLLWRARFVGEPQRMRAAQEKLEKLTRSRGDAESILRDSAAPRENYKE